MTVELQRLHHRDLNLLRELRNANADAFFDDTYITVEMQQEWWYRYERNMDTMFYTVFMNGVTPAGFLSVTILGDHIRDGLDFYIMEIGNLLLATAYRGQGVMTAALTEVRRLYHPLTFWVAHVKEGNAASLKLFERAGFWTANQSKGQSA